MQDILLPNPITNASYPCPLRLLD